MPPKALNTPSVAVILYVLAIFGAVIGSYTILILLALQSVPFFPSRHVRVVPWGAASVLSVILVFLASQFLGVAGYQVYLALAGKVMPKLGEMPFVDQLILVSATNFLFVALVPLVLRMTSGTRLADLGLSTEEFGWNSARAVVLCFAMLVPVYGAMTIAVQFWPPNPHPVELMLKANRTFGVAVLAYLSAVISAPLGEELLFRGVLLASLWKLVPRVWPRRNDEIIHLLPDFPDSHHTFAAEIPTHEPNFVERSQPWMFVANLAVSLLFASLHYKQWPAPVPLFVLSLGLGYIYQRTGSLIAPVMLHATFNALSTTLMLLQAA